MNNYTTHNVVFYRILNEVTGKSYVGRTINAKTRKVHHFSHLKRQVHHSTKLQHSYNKHGKQAFRWEVLEQITCDDSYAYERETHWIQYFDSYNNGYNMSPSGEVSTYGAIACIWNGIEYSSLSEAAQANNLTIDTLRYRLKKGMTSEADVQGHEVACEWNNTQYKSIKEAAIANNVSPYAMLRRLRQGYKSDNDMRGSGGHNGKTTPCEWNGVQYSSLSEAARALGINNVTMLNRVRKGYICDADIPISRKKK